MESYLSNHEKIESCENPLAVTSVRLDGYFLGAVRHILKTFKNLENFDCQYVNTYKSNSINELLQLPKLRRMAFSKSYFSEIPTGIIHAEKLEVLDLTSAVIQTIPAYIGEAKALKELILDKNSIGEIDEALLALKNLKVLCINGFAGKTIPQVLLDIIPQLSELSLSKNLTKIFKKEYPHLYKNLPYLYAHSSAENKSAAKIRRYFFENATDWDLRAFLLNLLAGNEEKIAEQFSMERLLSAVNFPAIESIRLKAFDILEAQIAPEAKTALKKGASIAVLGKLGINKNELRQKLKDHNIRYEANISEKTTHCLLGQLPGDAVFEAVEKGLHLITEKYILAYWEEVANPYLLETVAEAPEQAENLASLLMSGQEDSILVALSMFRQGGFPKELMTELYIAYQVLPIKSTARREAERLLRQYGSTELMAHIKPNYIFTTGYESNGTAAKIRKMCDSTGLDGMKIAWFLYRKSKRAIAYLLIELPEEEAFALITNDLLKEGVLKLSGIGLTSIPPVIYKLGTTIEKLNLYSNHIGTVSNDIKQLSNLKELNLKFNSAIRNNKALVEKIKKLLPDCEVII